LGWRWSSIGVVISDEGESFRPAMFDHSNWTLTRVTDQGSYWANSDGKTGTYLAFLQQHNAISAMWHAQENHLALGKSLGDELFLATVDRPVSGSSDPDRTEAAWILVDLQAGQIHEIEGLGLVEP
jgi:hypothetical protein